MAAVPSCGGWRHFRKNFREVLKEEPGVEFRQRRKRDIISTFVLRNIQRSKRAFFFFFFFFDHLFKFGDSTVTETARRSTGTTGRLLAVVVKFLKVLK